MILSHSAAAILEVLERSGSVSRRDLRVMAAVRTDREMRDAIAELVCAGYTIVRGRGGKGYEFTRDTERIRKEIDALHSYDKSFHARLDGLARGLSELLGAGQRKIFG